MRNVENRKEVMRDFFNKVVSFTKDHPVMLGVLAAALIIPVGVMAWGPNRDTFTIEKPATRVVFNSITNNPDIGDERNFVRIRNLNDKNAQWSDDLKITESGEYVVRMYVHNNAADNLNLVATGTTAKFNVPTYSAKKIQIDGFLSATNAQPGTVYDQAIFTSDKNFKLSYVAGSANYKNNVFTSGVKLSDSVVNGSGSLLGYDKLDGKIPGCFKYSGWVSFTVKAEVEKTSDFTVEKTVRKNGEKTWTKSVNAKTGDKVDYQIEFKNTGEAQLNSVVIADQLPAGVEIVPGSVYLKNASNPNALNITDSLVHGGANIGHYTAGSNALLKFTAVVKDNSCGTKTLVNTASATTSAGKKNSTANVVVTKTCEPPKTPEYKCTGLSVTKLSRTKFEFNTTYTVKNTTFTGVKYVIKDASGKIIAQKTVAGGTKFTFESNQPGKYTVVSTVITANGENTNANCQKEFVIEEAPKVKTPEIKIEKTINGKKDLTVAENTDFTYEIVIRNTGEVDLKDAKITDKAPANVKFISADKGEIKDNVLTYTVPSLKVGESATVKIVAQATASNMKAKNVACVNTPTIPGDNDGCDSANIEVPKKSDPTPPTPTTPPVPTTPSELPQTGIDGIGAIVAISSLTAASAYYIASRKLI